jgi:hypothetical protein
MPIHIPVYSHSQIKMSKIEFDYVEYAALRLRGYLFLRESFWPEARLLEVKKL